MQLDVKFRNKVPAGDDHFKKKVKNAGCREILSGYSYNSVYFPHLNLFKYTIFITEQKTSSEESMLYAHNNWTVDQWQRDPSGREMNNRKVVLKISQI